MSREPAFDVLQVVARYAPGDQLAEAEWPLARRSDVLGALITTRPSAPGEPLPGAAHDIPVHFIPTRRSGARRRIHIAPRLLPLASGAAVVAIAAAAVVAVANSGRNSGGPDLPGGAAFAPPAGLSTTATATDLYSHRVDEQMDLDAAGQPKPGSPDAMVNRNWVAADGKIVSIRTGSQNACFVFAGPTTPTLEQPTRDFFASLPTDVDGLNTYLRAHVAGSSSHDEAVFVAVGDLLRPMDGFASPALRGAMVGVLSRTPGVTVHLGQRDYLGRPAIRADFVDQQLRPGEIQSLYFDQSTFQLLEERNGRPDGLPASATPSTEGASGAPVETGGASPAYTAAATDGPSAEQLTGPAYVDLVRTEEPVDKLPPLPADCKNG
jgi:hypothetical protein